jgi:hypothetical protein
MVYQADAGLSSVIACMHMRMQAITAVFNIRSGHPERIPLHSCDQAGMHSCDQAGMHSCDQAGLDQAGLDQAGCMQMLVIKWGAGSCATHSHPKVSLRLLLCASGL